MPRSSPAPLLAISLLTVAVACGGTEPPETPAPDGARVEGKAESVSDPAAPASVDSVIVWVREIREGIEPLAGQVGADPAATRQRAVELYVTRQERIEQTVGPGTGSTPALAESVHEAEARFHELMQLLGETPPPDSTRVAASVAALDARLAEVLERVSDGATAGETP